MKSFASSRRALLSWLGAGTGVAVLAGCGSTKAEAKSFPVSLSDAQWKQKLTKAEYYVLRQEGTERPYTSPLNKEKRAGTFVCAGCDNPVYSSKTKYDSGTGWPSFWKAVSGGVGTSTDRKLGYARTEVHCARCGGHLGHIFNDGPKPTGKRHCINGVALDFQPA